MYNFFYTKTGHSKHIFACVFQEPVYNKSLTMILHLNEPDNDFISCFSSRVYRLDMTLVKEKFVDKMFDSTLGYFTNQNDIIKYFQSSFLFNCSFGNRADVFYNIFENETVRTNIIDGIKNILIKTFGV